MHCQFQNKYFIALLIVEVVVLSSCSKNNPVDSPPNVTAHGEWNLQYPYPSDADYNDLAIVGNNIWAAGDGGTIVRSSDFGATWTIQRTSCSNTLRALAFVDDRHGWAVEDNSTLLHTTDGGKSWRLDYYQVGNNLTSISFADPMTGWVIGRYGSLFTTDGGKRWQPSTERAAVVRFVDSKTGYLFTVTGGVKSYSSETNSWVTRGQITDVDSIESVAFLSPSIGIAAGVINVYGDPYKGLFVTRDSCMSWEFTGLIPPEYACGLSFDAKGNAYFTGDGGIGVSRDTGRHWSERVGPTGDVSLNAIRFGSGQNGIAVGKVGRIFTTSDGGFTWDQSSRGIWAEFWDIAAIDASTAVAVGTLGAYRTHDGGITWTRTSDYLGANSVAFSDLQHGCMVGEQGTVAITTNGGIDWTFPPKVTGEYLYQVELLNASVGLMAGSSDLWQTVDGGETWKKVVGVGPVYSMSFADSLHGWAIDANSNILVRTIDGGIGWDSIAGPLPTTMLSLFFLDTALGWSVGVGNDVYKTEDGGTTWTLHLVPGNNTGLTDIAFCDSLVGWAVGSGGAIFVSEDGGKSWSSCEVASTKLLLAVSLADRRNGWAVGFKGTIMRLQ